MMIKYFYIDPEYNIVYDHIDTQSPNYRSHDEDVVRITSGVCAVNVYSISFEFVKKQLIDSLFAKLDKVEKMKEF